MATETGIDLQTLSRRIVEAARLAASVHLYESLPHKSEHYGRRVMIGGAGPDTQGDGAENSSVANHPGRTAVVTDDVPAAHPPEAAGLSRRPPRYIPAD